MKDHIVFCFVRNLNVLNNIIRLKEFANFICNRNTLIYIPSRLLHEISCDELCPDFAYILIGFPLNEHFKIECFIRTQFAHKKILIKKWKENPIRSILIRLRYYNLRNVTLQYKSDYDKSI